MVSGTQKGANTMDDPMVLFEKTSAWDYTPSVNTHTAGVPVVPQKVVETNTGLTSLPNNGSPACTTVLNTDSRVSESTLTRDTAETQEFAMHTCAGACSSVDTLFTVQQHNDSVPLFTSPVDQTWSSGKFPIGSSHPMTLRSHGAQPVLSKKTPQIGWEVPSQSTQTVLPKKAYQFEAPDCSSDAQSVQSNKTSQSEDVYKYDSQSVQPKKAQQIGKNTSSSGIHPVQPKKAHQSEQTRKRKKNIFLSPPITDVTPMPKCKKTSGREINPSTCFIA